MRKLLPLLPLLVIYLFGCNSTGRKSNHSSDNHALKSTKNVSYNNDSVQLITLPTPLQIPTLMKNTDKVYSQMHLMPIINPKQTSFKSSILLGIYMLDMSYAGIYSNHQKSLDYLSQCRDVSDAIGINGTFTEVEFRRFTQNLSYPDSVANVILEVYDRGHQILISQEKQGHGLLMVLGCFMEGMYLTVHEMRLQDFKLFVHALSLQKNYGQNIELMLNYYEIPEDIKLQYDIFKRTHELLNQYEYPTLLEMKEGTKNTKYIDQSLIEELKQITTEFRNSMVN